MNFKTLFTFLVLFSCASGYAQVPNEDCSGSIQLTPSEFGISTWLTNSLGNSSSGVSCFGNPNDDVWFKFTARSSNDIILAQDPAAAYDAVIEVYAACGGSSLGCGNNYPAGQIERFAVGNLIPGQEYFFRVFNADASAGTGLQVQVQVKTFADTRLSDTDCGRLDFELQNVILSLRNDLGQLYQTSGIGVDGYGFWIQSLDGSQSTIIQQTTGYPFSLQLVNIPWLQYGEIYEVRVQHRVIVSANGSTQNLWSHFGEICLIGLDAVPPSTQLRPQFCGASVNESATVIANQVTGAELYRFIFNGPQGTLVRDTPNYGLLLSSVGNQGSALIQGFTYQVTVQCQINGIWSEPGLVCDLTINCQDFISPTLSEYPANLTGSCGSTPGVPTVTAYDAEAGTLALSYLSYTFDTSDIIYEVSPNLTGIPGLSLPLTSGNLVNFTWTSAPVFLVSTETGAYLLGELIATDGSNARWEVHIVLNNKTNWSEWNSQFTTSAPFIPRSYRDDSGIAASQGNAWTNWSYFVIDDAQSFLRGKGSLNGSFLQLSQAPATLQYGFQLGNAANNQSTGFGFSSWVYGSGIVNGQSYSDFGTLTSMASELGTMEEISCQPWELRKWTCEDPCGNAMGTDQLVTYENDICHAPTNLDVIEIGFGTMNPRVNGVWNNGEGSADCQVRGGRLLTGSYENGSPQFHNPTNTQVIGQTNGSTLNFNIALYDNPNIPFKLGKYYGFEVRCACGDGSGYSDWSGLSLGSCFLVPEPPGLQEGSSESKSFETELSARVYPNPNEGSAFLLEMVGLSDEKGLVILRITDLQGRLIEEALLNYNKGDIAQYYTPHQRLKAGIYILQVIKGNAHKELKLLVE